MLLVFIYIYLTLFCIFKSLLIKFSNDQGSFFFFSSFPAEVDNRSLELVFHVSVPGSFYHSAIRIMYPNHCYFSISKNIPLENLKMIFVTFNK